MLVPNCAPNKKTQIRCSYIIKWLQKYVVVKKCILKMPHTILLTNIPPIRDMYFRLGWAIPLGKISKTISEGYK